MSATVIGTEGRKVRCSRCGTTWHQERTASEPRQEAAAPPPRQVAAAPAYARPYPPPPLAEPPPPQPVYAAPAPPPPVIEEPPARAAQPVPEVSSARSESPQDELRRAFGEDVDTAPVVAPAEEEDYEEAAPPDDLRDAEPVPEVYTPFRTGADRSLDAESEPRGRRWGLILGIPLAFLLAVAAGAYFGRDFVIAYVPEAANVYRDLGLYAEPPGAGLEIRDTHSSRINSDQGLMITGVVANISDQPRKVPLIKVMFHNFEGEEVQSVIVQPAKADLPPTDQFTFQARIERLAPTARKLEVTFTTPELEGQPAVAASKN